MGIVPLAKAITTQCESFSAIGYYRWTKTKKNCLLSTLDWWVENFFFRNFFVRVSFLGTWLIFLIGSTPSKKLSFLLWFNILTHLLIWCYPCDANKLITRFGEHLIRKTNEVLFKHACEPFPNPLHPHLTIQRQIRCVSAKSFFFSSCHWLRIFLFYYQSLLRSLKKIRLGFLFFWCWWW